jgi:translation elongation factor P/translation initiation factor 5A
MNSKTALKNGGKYLIYLKREAMQRVYPDLREVTVIGLTDKAIKFVYDGGTELWMSNDEFYDRYEIYESLTAEM